MSETQEMHSGEHPAIAPDAAVQQDKEQAPTEPAAPGEVHGEAPSDAAAHHGLRRPHRFHHLISPRRWLQRLVFWGGAVAIACVSAAFTKGAEQADELLHHALGLWPYLPFVVTPVSIALIVAVTRYFPGSEGSGIPQTIAAIAVTDPSKRKGLLGLRTVVGKMVLTLVALATGASVGREGPTVQIGAAIMDALGRLVRFSRHDMEKGLILAGGAAGVAAAFNTPLAGVVFAIEEMSRSFESRTSGTILTAVIVAGAGTIAVVGNYSYFGHTAASLGLGEGWIAIAVCGVAGGLAGGIFSQLLILFSRGLPGRIGALAREHPVYFGALCGLLLAIIGFAAQGTTYGTGYKEARLIIEGAAELPYAYGVLKLVATLISYISGIPGGIFSPSLAIGAGLGANLAHLMPYAPTAAVALLGMVAYFAGVVQAPITAFVIVMEMTDNHEMVVPLMAAALIGTGISRLVCPEPLYGALAAPFLRRVGAPERISH